VHRSVRNRVAQVLTSGRQGISKGLSSGLVGTLNTPLGTQVRYDGKPLYLFGDEGLSATASGIAATGSGNGIVVGAGTFKLINV